MYTMQIYKTKAQCAWLERRKRPTYWMFQELGWAWLVERLQEWAALLLVIPAPEPEEEASCYQTRTFLTSLHVPIKSVKKAPLNAEEYRWSWHTGAPLSVRFLFVLCQFLSLNICQPWSYYRGRRVWRWTEGIVLASEIRLRITNSGFADSWE
jgi:hypothetical protein